MCLPDELHPRPHAWSRSPFQPPQARRGRPAPMPDRLQTSWLDDSTNPHDPSIRRGLYRLPRVQFDGRHPRRSLLLPPVRHRTYLCENRPRKEVHKMGHFGVVDWRRDGVLGDLLGLVHPMKQLDGLDECGLPSHYVVTLLRSHQFFFVLLGRRVGVIVLA